MIVNVIKCLKSLPVYSFIKFCLTRYKHILIIQILTALLLVFVIVSVGVLWHLSSVTVLGCSSSL